MITPEQHAEIRRLYCAIRIGCGIRPLSGFVMVLSYSRAVFALFTVDQALESFSAGSWNLKLGDGWLVGSSPVCSAFSIDA